MRIQTRGHTDTIGHHRTPSDTTGHHRPCWVRVRAGEDGKCPDLVCTSPKRTVWPLEKTILQFLVNLNPYSPRDLATPPPGPYPGDTKRVPTKGRGAARVATSQDQKHRARASAGKRVDERGLSVRGRAALFYTGKHSGPRDGVNVEFVTPRERSPARKPAPRSFAGRSRRDGTAEARMGRRTPGRGRSQTLRTEGPEGISGGRRAWSLSS